MPPTPDTFSRPRSAGHIARYLAAGIFGLGCTALGSYEMTLRYIGIFHGFFASTAEAATSAAGGAVVLIWSSTRLLREIRRPRANREAGSTNADSTKTNLPADRRER